MHTWSGNAPIGFTILWEYFQFISFNLHVLFPRVPFILFLCLFFVKSIFVHSWIEKATVYSKLLCLLRCVCVSPSLRLLEAISTQKNTKRVLYAAIINFRCFRTMATANCTKWWFCACNVILLSRLLTKLIHKTIK